ncbi:unnamed protein product [Ambrosiozyma monospora]|uniref:ER membrane protein complex subunit 6 n=1 Tax=Ambrosiozyma monospora TaxID=43982 RepID=A0A9W6Z2P6_AMBMO|nr:unnamed protein product [Ambrosiozyma monospora]
MAGAKKHGTTQKPSQPPQLKAKTHVPGKSSTKKSSKKPSTTAAIKNDPFARQLNYKPNIDYNRNVVIRIKDITSLSFGTASGILKLTSLNGFLFFLATNIFTSLLTYVVLVGFKNKGTDYFVSPFNDVFVNDVGRYLASYLMMWCLFYALVST